MTRSRRPAERGRALAIGAAIVMLVGCLLPWHAFEGDLPGGTSRGLEGSGVLVVAAALAVLAVVSLRWAAADAAGMADRVDGWLTYAILAGVALLGVVAWPVAFLDAPAGLRPDRAPGLWVAAVGVVLLGVATRQIARETRLEQPGRR